MKKHRLLITEITDYGTLHCVAGWDLALGKMIRPEPSPGGFWSAEYVSDGRHFRRGAVVELFARSPDPPTEYPHRTEDRVVVGAINQLEMMPAAERNRILASTTSPDLDTLFDGHLQVEKSKGYIGRGVQCRSLGGIEVDARQFDVFEDTYKDKTKLRCRLWHRGFVLVPTLPSTLARETWHRDGLAPIRSGLSAAKRLHLRIGLARAFPADRCYMQVNDIYVIG
jgi:hypothetical protein